MPGYAIIIGPLVLAGMARYIRGGEMALRIIRPYLRAFEKRYGYQGYECYYDTLDVGGHGSGVKAVRNMLWLCEVLSAAIVGLRLWSDRPSLLAIITVSGIATLIAGAAMWVTWQWMKTPPKPRPKQPGQAFQKEAHDATKK
jgi:hypothetical protein